MRMRSLTEAPTCDSTPKGTLLEQSSSHPDQIQIRLLTPGYAALVEIASANFSSGNASGNLPEASGMQVLS